MKPATQTEAENIWDSAALRSRVYKNLVTEHNWAIWGLWLTIATTPLYHFLHLRSLNLEAFKNGAALEPAAQTSWLLNNFMLGFEILSTALLVAIAGYLFLTNLKRYRLKIKLGALNIGTHLLSVLSVLLPLAVFLYADLPLIISAFLTGYTSDDPAYETLGTKFKFKKTGVLLVLFAIIKLLSPFIVGALWLSSEGISITETTMIEGTL
ncbi:MAG: hypothetical protein H6861_01125 [Rhodospirillales bacterium]|nr:hypothetical protein [Rhodospirillales bacterium]